MSCNYAEGLSPYPFKGKLGLKEKFDSEQEVKDKVAQLAEWMRERDHAVVHTGAGISTAAGIPDFRGPKGVWTLEEKGEKPDVNVSWDDAEPTFTHLALAQMARQGRVRFVVSQNIDGLHMRSGLSRSQLAELHGNMFVDQCGVCQRMFVRARATSTVGQKTSGQSCPGRRPNGRPCRGRLHDFVLDWEHELPDHDLALSDAHCALADLNLVLGSTLQIVPAGNLPIHAKKYRPDRAKLVIVNLQPTKHDKKADLVIRAYVDDVMRMLLEQLEIEAKTYDAERDPVKRVARFEREKSLDTVEWTQDEDEAKRMAELGDKVEETWRLERKLARQKKKKEEEDEEEEDENEEEERTNITKKSKLTKPTHAIDDGDVKKENHEPAVTNGDASSLTSDIAEEVSTDVKKEDSDTTNGVKREGSSELLAQVKDEHTGLKLEEKVTEGQTK